MEEIQFEQMLKELVIIRKKISTIARIISIIVILGFIMGACVLLA